MRADIHDGQEARNAPCNGPNTDAQDELSPDRHIRLAPHGRSIQSIWSNDDGRRPARDGGPSCIITRQTLLPWFVVPTVGFDLLYAFVVVRLGRARLDQRHSKSNGGMGCTPDYGGISLG